MYKIAVIGAGQIGSRHLQGLAKLKFPVSIWVVDPSAEALQVAEERFKEMESKDKDMHWVQNVSEIKEPKIDLAIIATNSGERLQALRALTEHCQVAHLVLEKILFQTVEDYAQAQEIISKNNIKAWVNFPRLLNPYYRQLKNKLGKPFNMVVSGNAWGLASNSLHFISLFAFLADYSTIELEEFFTVQVPAKRAGYIEFFGTIKGQGANNNHLQISCFNAEPLIMTISLYSEQGYYQIDEAKPSPVRYRGPDTNWQWQEQSFPIDYQSTLTTGLAEQILQTGNSDLATYEQATALHLTYLKMLLAHLQKKSPDKIIKQCPIT